MTMHDRFPDYPLNEDEIRKLAIFNSQVAEGLVHRPGYAFDMAKLQAQHDAWVKEQNRKSGYDAWAVEQGITAQPGALRTAHVHVHLFDRLHGLCVCGESRT